VPSNDKKDEPIPKKVKKDTNKKVSEKEKDSYNGLKRVISQPDVKWPFIPFAEVGTPKVPRAVRQKVLYLMVKVYLTIHKNKEKATNEALRTEKEIYDKSSGRIVYNNSCAQIMQKLKKQAEELKLGEI